MKFDGSKLTVKYFVNKRLKPTGSSKCYPLYIRIMYKRKQIEFRSFVQYLMHARSEPRYQWTIDAMSGKWDENFEKQFTFFTDEKTLPFFSQQSHFVAEIKLIERIFLYFLIRRNINIIETKVPTSIIHPSMKLLSEVLSEYYSDQFLAELKKSRYSSLLDVMPESKNHFNLLVQSLKEIANEDFSIFLNPFKEKAEIVRVLKEMNPHLHVIDYLLDHVQTVDKIRMSLSHKNSYLESEKKENLSNDIFELVYKLLLNIVPSKKPDYLLTDQHPSDNWVVPEYLLPVPDVSSEVPEYLLKGVKQAKKKSVNI